MEGLADCFSELRDLRPSGSRRHDLLEVLMIALCAVLSGGRTAVDMAVFAEAKQEFLRKFLPLTNGVPSHDTFSRLLKQIDPNQFRACFQKFVARFDESCGGVIAIDGKTLHRTSDLHGTRSVLHMISAWSCEKRLVIAQIATDTKARESAAVLDLLELLSLTGSIVTTDALNCQREIAQRIVDKGGDYVLALKGNHRTLHADVSLLLSQPRHASADQHSTIDNDHGRIERRVSVVSTEVDELQKRHRWPGLAAVGKIIRSRGTAARLTNETVHYLLSRPLSSARLGEVARSHWGIENRLHWVLNSVMNEDQIRHRSERAAYNLAILRHMALNLLQKDRSKGSLRSKFNLAAWKDEFLASLLAHTQARGEELKCS
jgi:predicted transposase YbfD/YdcC